VRVEPLAEAGHGGTYRSIDVDFGKGLSFADCGGVLYLTPALFVNMQACATSFVRTQLISNSTGRRGHRPAINDSSVKEIALLNRNNNEAAAANSPKACLAATSLGAEP